MSSEHRANPDCPEPQLPDPLNYHVRALGLPNHVLVGFLEKKGFSPSHFTKVETIQFSMDGWQVWAAIGGRMERNDFVMTVCDVDVIPPSD